MKQENVAALLSVALAVTVINLGGFIYLNGGEAEAKTVKDEILLLNVSDILMPKPPKVETSEKVKKEIDKETDREWHADDPEEIIEEVVEVEEYVEPAEYIYEEYSYDSDPNSLYYRAYGEYGAYYGWENDSYDGDLQAAGAIYGADGTKYTWYSQNVLPGGGLTELNENGRTVDDRGYVVDGDGYIAVASSDHEKGTVIDTPFGQAKVYDTGCDSGVIDVYTNF